MNIWIIMELWTVTFELVNIGLISEVWTLTVEIVNIGIITMMNNNEKKRPKAKF